MTQKPKWPERPPDGPLYSCDIEWCREERSFPPYMLRYLDLPKRSHPEDPELILPAIKGWYCDDCHMELGDPDDIGISLTTYMERHILKKEERNDES